VWVATGRSLNRFSGRGRTAFELDRTMALHADNDGRLWAVAGRGVGRFDESGFHPLPTPPGIRFGRIVSLTTDAHGGVWLCSNEQGLMRWHGGRLDAFDEAPAIAGRQCSFVYADRRARVWAGFSSGGVAVYENGGFHTYTTAEGLAQGRIAAIQEDRSGSIWIGSAMGLTRIRDDVLTTVARDNGLPDGIVHSIVEDDEGHLWLGVKAGAGVIRVSPGEIERAATEPGYQIDYLLYDETDGLEELLWPSLGRSAVRGGDGRLWFMSGSGVAVIDPRFLPARPSVARPRIDRVVANGRTIAARPELVMPAGTDTLQVHFSTLSLTSASKLRFRYRLDDVEQRWVYAGLDQQASFVNLTPGRYRFRVGATAGGDWSENETIWPFAIAYISM
jgi:ligand-binding sensor domain-containing protein